MSFWACGSILISNTTVGRFEPFYCNDKYFYRPQTKVIFLHLSVILFTGESTWAGTPLGRYTSSPPGQVPPRQVHPLAGTPPRQVHPPGQIHTPQAGTPPMVHAGIRSTSGRYASYWNAFLLSLNSLNSVKTFWENSIDFTG